MQSKPDRHWSLAVTFLVVGGLATIAGQVRPIVDPPHDIWVAAFGVSCVLIGMAAGLHEILRNWGKTIATCAVSLILIVLITTYRWTHDFWLTHSAAQASTNTAPQLPLASQVPPSLAQPAFPERAEEIRFDFGQNWIGMRREDLEKGPVKPMETFGDACPLDVSLSLKNGALYVDADLVDVSRWHVSIKQNTLIDSPPDWDHNSNAAALEFVNEHGIPVFQLIKKSPSEIELYGSFITPVSTCSARPNSGVSIGPTLPQPLTPIFKYPAWKYPGVYAQQR